MCWSIWRDISEEESESCGAICSIKNGRPRLLVIYEEIITVMGRSSLDQAGSHIISWWTRSSIRAASSWGSFDCSLPWTSSQDGCSSPLLWTARPTCHPTHSLEQCPNKISLFGLLKDGTIDVDHIGKLSMTNVENLETWSIELFYHTRAQAVNIQRCSIIILHNGGEGGGEEGGGSLANLVYPHFPSR